ncbi:GNAT family N-acetyltransferase [Oceanobacillus manasiensis]|uniref:GNAT family N-acetyltransferase n=1 Tax=Oceanobacillus manasiensis TaxID=586413 RepID=UPI0006946D83|nr:GNAT family N-acetyltransferase [Oceanobacillus manasiensis]
MNLFHTIKSPGKYWLVDQLKKNGIPKEMYEASLSELVKEWQSTEYGFISVLLEESSESVLLDRGFNKVSTIVEYTKSLNSIEEQAFPFYSNRLSEGNMTNQDYAGLYERCRSGSANKNKKQPIEEVMGSLESELGPTWRDFCYYFTLDGEVCGISIPHIEDGTADEGRMFYFGVVPEMRGRGVGASMHLASLLLLKQKDATYYVGSTDTSNQAMINIFIKNGCTLRDRKGIYRLEKQD